MAFGVGGHNEENDDVFTPTTGKGGPSNQVGGSGVISKNNRLWNPAGTGYAYDKDVNRLRAEGAQTQDAVQLDQSEANQSRDMQLGSLGHLMDQANGSAASSAQILSQRANQAAAQQIGAAGLRKGGPGAAIASMNMAAPQVGAGALAANAQNANMRAGEISRGQSAYASGALGAHGQDIQAATANAQLVAQQRALDESRQQANEKLAWDTRKAQMNNANEFTGQRQTEELHRRQTSAAQAAEDEAKVYGYANMGLGAVTGGVAAVQTAAPKDPKETSGSDERMKMRSVPMGSLSSLDYR